MSHPEEHIHTELENKKIGDIDAAFGKREQKTFQEIQDQNAILIEGIPQMEAVCERNQSAMQMFSERHILPLVQKYNLGAHKDTLS